MILEVNNTFDERRMYFLKNTDTGVPDSPADIIEDGSNDESTANQSGNIKPHTAEIKARTKFTTSWAKDFHVSPFNSRKGSYSLMAEDPFSRSNSPVNNTITLSSSSSHAKLVARVFSTSNSVDPASLTRWEMFRFLASWWWVGFVTFPRIVREAGKLFFKRKLQVWYRPEVLRDSIGRHETSDERAIAYSFCALLHSLVSQSDLSVPLRFESGISTSSSPEIFFPNRLRQTQESPGLEPIHFKIATPLFYARLARHSHISEFLASEILNQDDKTRTCYNSRNPEVVLALFADETSPIKSTNASATVSSPPIPRNTSPLAPLPLLLRFRWSLLLILRNLNREKGDNRRLRFSTLDEFVMQHEDTSTANQYRRALMKFLASDLLAFGIPEIIDAVFWLIRAMLCYMHVEVMRSWLQGGGKSAIGVWGLVVGCLGVHVWWLLERNL